MGTPVTVEELQARNAEIRSRVEEIDSEFAGQALPEPARTEWAELNAEEEANTKLIQEFEVRRQRISELSGDPDKQEGPAFNINVRKTEADIYDLTQIRASADNPAGMRDALRDHAKRAIERSDFPSMNKEQAQTNAEHVLDTADDNYGNLARRFLLTGNPTYRRAWAKYVTGQARNAEEERVMSLTTNSGGYGVPFALDPTILLSSNGGINPFRQIARVEQINVDIWQGISSAGTTAAFQAELSEVADGALTIAQPSVTTQMARCFVPYSIEIGMDYPNFAAQIANAIADAKDVLEATKFALGTGTNEPQGIITGATGVVTASTRGSITSTDVYAVEAALPPRFIQNASWVASRIALQKFRQFDTAGGAQLWIQNLQYGLGQAQEPGNAVNGRVAYALLGYNAFASSDITSTLTTGNKLAVLGDFKQFLIADRVGLSVEYIPHMFNTANNLPSGERGAFAYWRTGSGVLFTNAFRTYLL